MVNVAALPSIGENVTGLAKLKQNTTFAGQMRYLKIILPHIQYRFHE
jgi:hypothetical protein